MNMWHVDTITAAMQTYHVKVTTGTVWGAGTDANVFCVLHGEKDDTGTVYIIISVYHPNNAAMI